MTSAQTTAPTTAQIDQLRRAFSGDVITPDTTGYDDARRVWNAVFDRRPAVIVRPSTVDDVVAAVRFGRERDLEIAVRGGGHSAVGHSTTEGGLVIDLGRMNEVSVDPGRRLARTGGGALLGQLDIAAQEHGLVCPVGVVGHTGVAGLTLGGGVGRLQRQLGLTIDSLRAVELVTADGRHVRASADEEPELFWGLRGAGANFGVATSLELDLHRFSGTLHRGVHIHPATDIHKMWAIFRDFATAAPETIAAIFTIALAEPAADYPDPVAGSPIVVISYNHSGAGEDVERDIAPLLKGPKPASTTASSEQYLTAQRSSDLALAWGSRPFILGAYVADLSAQVLDALCDRSRRGRRDGLHRTDGPIRRQPGHGLDEPRSRRGERRMGPPGDGDHRARSAAWPLHQRAIGCQRRDHPPQLRRREARAPARPQANVGPDQRLSPEPQHPAGRRLTLIRHYFTTR
jgi:hypothetical protein